jgi:hypothetical protein
MTTSGTASFNMDMLQVLEEAFERAGRSFRSGYDYESARVSLNLLFTDWANAGINLWTLADGTVPVVADTSTYTLPADTVDVLDVSISIGATDYLLTRIGFRSWSDITLKATKGRPTQVFVERLRDGPTVRLWPVPDKAYTLKYWRLRRIQDAGTALNNPDVPFRFLPALTAGLALRIARKNPQLDVQRIGDIEREYMQTLSAAQGEDRERASFWLRPPRRTWR